MIGDGGQSGFDVAIPEFRFHNFTGASPDVNFNNGDFADWIWIGRPVFGHGGEFYAPVISDPVVSKTMFAGTSRTAYRTKTAGLGTRTIAEANQLCNEWTGDFRPSAATGPSSAPSRLTDAAWGDRAGGDVAAIERTKADTSTAGRRPRPAASSSRRTSTPSPAQRGRPGRGSTTTRRSTPNRFVSRASTSTRPTGTTPGSRTAASTQHAGHAGPRLRGDVSTRPPARRRGRTRSTTWATCRSTDLVRDDVTGDLYASTTSASRLAAGTTSWVLAAPGMPNVEVAGLTIVRASGSCTPPRTASAPGS